MLNDLVDYNQYWGIARYLIIESVCIDDCFTTSNHSKKHVYSQSSSLQDIFLTFVSNVVGKLFFKTKVLMIHQNKFVRSMTLTRRQLLRKNENKN